MKKIFFITIMILLAVTYLSIFTGVVDSSFFDFINGNLKETTLLIINKIRLPRVILAILIGASLSISGVVMQTFTRNPLADPYILGVSSGASLGATLAIFLGANLIISPLAFIGAILAVILVFFLSKSGNYSSSRLVLTGVAVSSIFSSFTTFLTLFSGAEGAYSALFWIVGGLSGVGWEGVKSLGIVFGISLIILTLLAKELDILLLGEESSRLLGVNSKLIRNIAILISTLLVGLTVAKGGVIAFVGLVVPHIARRLVGNNHRILILYSALLGGTFLSACDLLARTVISSAEIPVGVITSLIGGPFFLYIMKYKSREELV